MSKQNISLVIFTCEGREHLLQHTLQAFRKNCHFNFHSTILAIDGPVSPTILSLVQPDILVQSYHRKGYFHNILQAVRQLQSPYFFWLEDDWNFAATLNIEQLQKKLMSDPGFSQIALAKEAVNSHHTVPMGDNFYKSPYSFSTNPSLCRTDLLLNALHHLTSQKIEGNFEVAIRQYMLDQQFSTLLYFHEAGPAAFHCGYLESTARNYHLISLSENNQKKYITAMGNPQPPSIINKVMMLLKLWWVSTQLSIRLLFRRDAYDFVFRICRTYLNK